MSTRQRLTNDPYVRTLEKRAQLASNWYDAIATALWEDLQEFKEEEAKKAEPSYALETLELKLTGDVPVPDGDKKHRHRSELIVSTRCSAVRVVANDPTGWISLEVVKKSPLFSGVLHRGAIEMALFPHGTGHDEIHFVECDWLNADGSALPRNGAEIADKLWDILFLPKIRHQLAAAQKANGR